MFEPSGRTKSGLLREVRGLSVPGQSIRSDVFLRFPDEKLEGRSRSLC